MQKIESHKHFFLGENRQWFPRQEIIVHMAEPRCFIRIDPDDDMLANYEEFCHCVVDVQWIDGKPDESVAYECLRNAWDFLCIEQKILEDFFDPSS